MQYHSKSHKSFNLFISFRFVFLGMQNRMKKVFRYIGFLYVNSHFHVPPDNKKKRNVERDGMGP